MNLKSYTYNFIISFKADNFKWRGLRKTEESLNLNELGRLIQAYFYFGNSYGYDGGSWEGGNGWEEMVKTVEKVVTVKKVKRKNNNMETR